MTNKWQDAYIDSVKSQIDIYNSKFKYCQEEQAQARQAGNQGLLAELKQEQAEIDQAINEFLELLDKLQG